MPSWRKCNGGLAASVLFGLLAAPAWSASLSNADLIKAVRAGDITAVHAMIQRGVDVNAPEATGTTALHWAAYQEDVSMVKSLLAAGAKVRVVNEFGSSPMQ